MKALPRPRQRWLVLAATATIAAAIGWPGTSFADNGTGCDFFKTAKNGTTTNLCVIPLSGSTFAGADGNLLKDPTTFGTSDWENAPAPLGVGIDKASGTGDNSFGQGTKEDNPNVTVVSGSIPPNKSDLTRFYQASETVSGQTFLYLAWERSNVLGNANMDFEINQVATTNLGTAGSHKIVRTGGDLLVTFDFVNGGGRPVIGLNTWVTSASAPVVPGFSTNACLSSSTFPCWGDHTQLTGDIAIGAVNSDAVTDPIQTGSANECPSGSCPALTFGETAINLTAAKVFGTGTCKTFASTYLKSRASASFTAEVKDFVAPIPTQITNCGTVTIIKHTDPAGINQDFSYTSNVTGTTTATGTTSCPTGSGAFKLNDSATNRFDCFNVPASTNYKVTETQAANFTLESLKCTATGTGASGSQDGTNPLQADITVTPESHVTCTYVNKQQLGAIKIIKTGKDKNCVDATTTITNGVCTGSATANLSGATFTIVGTGVNQTVTTGPNGTVCVDKLPLQAYTVTETGAPTGYKIDTTAGQSVTVNANSTCGDGNEATKSFSDSPKTNLVVTATAQVPGATKSTITCVDSSATGIGNSPQGPSDPAKVTAIGLKPGTYTCSVVIDP